MDWRPDVLGGFEQLPLALPADEEGAVVATLVRPTAAKAASWGREPHGFAHGIDVLYVHGWSDYFFQTEHALFWTRAGARFHALDLRKYGRSLLPHQTPGYTDDLAVYDAELAAALTAMGRDSDTLRPLVLVGHSTGGLTLALWAARHPEAVDALILNSPWLEFQADALGRRAIAPIVALGARLGTRAALPAIDPGFNTQASSRLFDGEWDYDLQWRPERGFPVHSAWLDAVLDGHARVADGLDIGVPVLVMLSSRSWLQTSWSPRIYDSDVALDVDGVAERATRLGRHVSVVRIDGALHDVLLSRRSVRASAYDVMARWTRAYLPETASVDRLLHSLRG
ncbi:alpha/beta hydrolase [Homoserinibacter gongjuensis]|jgi:alpha-beta hydrolase superfamily lysophospholipase|uniref:Lysophospholipase n=1 Tax=Homoserinibacter gongjuensis TaxID=1162968 RepID=A0ABQ6JVM8_9MICO|nr:alpha/beta hydrolase [Homoserinibacter gongjuensis]GMA90805.1 lysophospholipase [Homoserinibacter gongjuensis]